MAGIGPPPTPTAILRARGSWLAKTRDGEPEFPVERPDCPQALTGEARREWTRQADALEGMGVLALVDRALLASWCRTWGEWVELVLRMDEARPGADGKTKVRTFTPGTDDWLKLAKARRETTDQLIRLAGQLGFSPSARTRIRTEKPKAPADPLEAYRSA